MQYFIGLVHQEGDSAFGIQFPDVPSCFSAADELDGILPNAVEALSLALEGEAIPAARSLSEVRSDPVVAEGLAEGAFLLAVPHISLEDRTERFNVSMDAGMIAAIDAAAKARGVSRSAFLAGVAKREIEGR